MFLMGRDKLANVCRSPSFRSKTYCFYSNPDCRDERLVSTPKRGLSHPVATADPGKMKLSIGRGSHVQALELGKGLAGIFTIGCHFLSQLSVCFFRTPRSFGNRFVAWRESRSGKRKLPHGWLGLRWEWGIGRYPRKMGCHRQLRRWADRGWESKKLPQGSFCRTDNKRSDSMLP